MPHIKYITTYRLVKLMHMAYEKEHLKWIQQMSIDVLEERNIDPWAVYGEFRAWENKNWIQKLFSRKPKFMKDKGVLDPKWARYEKK